MARPNEPRSWSPRKKINPKDPRELAYWAERFQTSEDELRDTIAEVGPRTAAVATEFGCVVKDVDIRP